MRQRFHVFRSVALVLVDLAAAAGAWLITLRNLAVWSELDSNPPICSNYYGRTMRCDTSDVIAHLAAMGAFLVVLVGLLWLERRKGWV